MKWSIVRNKIKGNRVFICSVLSIMLSIIIVLPTFSQSFASRNGITENDPPITCRLGELATGIECSDRFCGRINLLCSVQENFEITHRYWSPSISEEGSNNNLGVSSSVSRDSVSSNSLVLSSDKFISGISCQGHYCDYISVEASVIRDKQQENCDWSPWISDEQGRYEFPGQTYASGIECRGSNCDEKRLYLCDIRDS